MWGERLVNRIDWLNRHIGALVSWLTIAMVLMTASNVLRRYLFQAGMPWEQEILYFMNSILFLLAMGYTYLVQGHVRVDILQDSFSPRLKAGVEMAGILLLLWPMCAAIAWYSWPFVRESWRIWEGSSEYLGMPGVFLLKTMPLLACTLLTLQGVSQFLKAMHHWRYRTVPESHPLP